MRPFIDTEKQSEFEQILFSYQKKYDELLNTKKFKSEADIRGVFKKMTPDEITLVVRCSILNR